MLGKIALEQGGHDRARKYFEHALALDATNLEASAGLAQIAADGFISLGKMALKQRRYDQAHEYFERALALDATNLEARAGLVRIAEVKKRSKDNWVILLIGIPVIIFIFLACVAPKLALTLAGVAGLAVVVWRQIKKRRS